MDCDFYIFWQFCWPVFLSISDGEKMEFWFLSFVWPPRRKFWCLSRSLVVLSTLFCKLLRRRRTGQAKKETTTLSSFYSLVTDVDSTKNFSSEGKHISIWFKWKVIKSEGKTTSTQWKTFESKEKMKGFSKSFLFLFWVPSSEIDW